MGVLLFVTAGVFFWGGYLAAALYFRLRKNAIVHTVANATEFHDRANIISTRAQEVILRETPFDMLWCAVDAKKRICAMNDALSALAQSVIVPEGALYAMSIFRNATIDQHIDCALTENMQQYARSVKLFGTRWDVHLIPKAHHELQGTHDNLSGYDDEEIFVLIACVPSTQGDDLYENVQEEFLQNVAHELKNPLTTIIGFADLLQKDENNKMVIERIQRQGSRLFGILDNMILLTKHAQPTRNFTYVNLDECARAAMEELEEKARENHIHLRFEYGADAPLRVHGNEFLLSTALKNLIENAIKYGAPESTVTVRAYAHKDVRENNADWYACVSVADEGAGILPKYQEKIFQRFYRVDLGRSRAQGGTGLGLAITKKIIEAHKGNITLVSEVEKGSVFTIRIAQDLS